jgi:hypothetical protein
VFGESTEQLMLTVHIVAGVQMTVLFGGVDVAQFVDKHA